LICCRNIGADNEDCCVGHFCRQVEEELRYKNPRLRFELNAIFERVWVKKKWISPRSLPTVSQNPFAFLFILCSNNKLDLENMKNFDSSLKRLEQESQCENSLERKTAQHASAQ
jgi:hypothetical protein